MNVTLEVQVFCAGVALRCAGRVELVGRGYERRSITQHASSVHGYHTLLK